MYSWKYYSFFLMLKIKFLKSNSGSPNSAGKSIWICFLAKLYFLRPKLSKSLSYSLSDSFS